MATTKQELETYLWEGKDKRGQETQGRKRQAAMKTLIKAELRQQGILPSTRSAQTQSTLRRLWQTHKRPRYRHIYPSACYHADFRNSAGPIIYDHQIKRRRTRA